MASEDEDLLEDGLNYKVMLSEDLFVHEGALLKFMEYYPAIKPIGCPPWDLGELEDLDDDAENALLGDSDEEGSSRARDRAPSLRSNNSQQQSFSGGEGEADIEEEQEFEYVDEDGNPVEIGSNDDVEYVEVTQEDENQTELEESTNEFVLDLVVDADLEFDDSGLQDTGNDALSSSASSIRKKKPKAKQSLPQPKEDKRRQPQEQKKAAQAKVELRKPPNHKQQSQENRRQQQGKREDQQQWWREQQQNEKKLQEQRNKEQQRIQQQMVQRQQKQQQFLNVKSSLNDVEKSTENDEHSFNQEGSFNSAVDNEEKQEYNSSLKNESSESEDEEESGRGRFRTERSNVISVSTAKKRANIPDSLEAVISHEEAARLERSNRLQSKRPWQRGGPARNSIREKERDRNRDNRDKGRSREHVRNYKEAPSMSRPQEFEQSNLAHFQPHSDSAPSVHDSDSSTNSEQRASRKILINPHFKGSIVPSTEAVPQSSYSWDTPPAAASNPYQSDHSTSSGEFHYMPPPQQPTEDHFSASFGTQASCNLSNLPSAPQNPTGQFNFSQPPPIKHNPPFHVPPPTASDFQARPPPLMSIPPIVPPSNHHGPPTNLFPPPREQPVPRLPFAETKPNEMQQVQYQPGNDSWTHSSNQHTFKPYNVPPPNQGFPPNPQTTVQPPPNFPNVQQLPPPHIQRAEFQHQLVPPAGPPPSFNRPPPGFNMNMRLSGPPSSRPMVPTWPTQQPQQRPPLPIPMPVFNRPPPPVGIGGAQNNFPITSLQTPAPPLFLPVRTSMSEQNMGSVGRFSQPGIQLGQRLTPGGQNSNLRSLPQQQQQQQQTWSKSNLRPIAQQKQPLFRKRLSNEAVSASPLKQVRITNQLLPTNRRMPHVNTNIRQVEIVDKLPGVDTLLQGPIRTRNKSQQGSNQAPSQQAHATSASKQPEDTLNNEAIEEDEETRRYRQQIELQKKKREEILRLKEQRRLLMAHERRKQMQEQQQRAEAQEEVAKPGPNVRLVPSPIEIVSSKSLSMSDVKQRVQNQEVFANPPDNALTTTGLAQGAKKRVVLVRRVTRPYPNLRRPSGLVGLPIKTVTNAGSLLGPMPFPPHLQPEQKSVMQHIPDIKARIPNSLKQVADQHWMQMASFSNNSNLTNITLQRPHTAEPQNPAAKPFTQNARALMQTPPSQIQPLQQSERVPQQHQRQLQQQPGRTVQQQGKSFQQPRNQQQFRNPQQQFIRPQHQLGRQQQQSKGPLQMLGRPQQSPRGPNLLSGKPAEFHPPNVISRLVTKQVDVIHQHQILADDEGGVVNVCPDVKQGLNSGFSNRIVINSNKRKFPARAAQPLTNQIPVHAMDVSAGAGVAERIVVVPQQTQQQVLPVNNNCIVQVENLAQATSDVQLRKLCQLIGPVDSINVFKEQRRALVKFKNGHHAKQFMDRYQRRMVDLSHISISLVS